mgnify:CR=1 FL=1
MYVTFVLVTHVTPIEILNDEQPHTILKHNAVFVFESWKRRLWQFQ